MTEPTSDFRTLLAERSAWKQAHPILHRFRGYWYTFRRFTWGDDGYLNPRVRYQRTKWFLQRGWRGWADCDVWSVDYYLARILPGMLRRLADTKHGVPLDFLADLPDGIYNHTPEQLETGSRKFSTWLIDKAEWFEWYARDDDGIKPDTGWIDPDLPDEEVHRRIAANEQRHSYFHDVVLLDFIKHLRSLWD